MLKAQEHLQYWSSPGPPVGLLHAELVQGKGVVLLLVQWAEFLYSDKGFFFMTKEKIYSLKLILIPFYSWRE